MICVHGDKCTVCRVRDQGQGVRWAEEVSTYSVICHLDLRSRIDRLVVMYVPAHDGLTRSRSQDTPRPRRKSSLGLPEVDDVTALVTNGYQNP